MYLIRFLTSILMRKQTQGALIPEQTQQSDAGRTNGPERNTASAGGLQQIEQILEHLVALLIEPTPAAIRQAALLLQSADECLRREVALQQKHCPEHIRNVERIMLRTRHMIEGALRIQRTQMRRLTAITQTYLRGGKLSQFYPGDPGFDVKV